MPDTKVDRNVGKGYKLCPRGRKFNIIFGMEIIRGRYVSKARRRKRTVLLRRFRVLFSF